MIGSGAPGSRVWRDLLVDATEEVMAISPDGSHVDTARYGPNASELIAIPLAGGPAVRLGDSAMSPGKGLSFSADGKRVAWSTCKSFASVVPLAERAGSTPQAWEDLDAARLPNGKIAVRLVIADPTTETGTRECLTLPLDPHRLWRLDRKSN